MTPAQLAIIADQLEAKAGVTNSRNGTSAGRWNRIALAAEFLSGTSTSANDNEAGWALRAAKAIESFGDVTPGNYNANEEGAIARLLNAFQTINGAVYTGSSAHRLQLATTAFDPYITEADTLFTRLSGTYNGGRKKAYNTFLKTLKDGGVLSGLEVLQILAAPIAADAINWISTSNTPSLISTPTFTANRGYAGNSTTTGVDSNWNPSTSALFTQNSATIGTWINGGTTTGSDTAYGAGVNQGGNGVFLGARNASDGIQGRVNQATSVGYLGVASLTRYGFAALSRTGAASTKAFKNGAPGSVSTTASSGRPNGNVYLGGLNTASALSNGVDSRFAVFLAGRGFTDAEMLILHNALNTLLTYIGAN